MEHLCIEVNNCGVLVNEESYICSLGNKHYTQSLSFFIILLSLQGPYLIIIIVKHLMLK